MDRQAILSAKVEKLAEIIMDGNQSKNQMAAKDVRKKQSEAAREVIESGSSVAEVKKIDLPGERQ